jgi:ribosomal protein S18 acetylase RimI-like enzyme
VAVFLRRPGPRDRQLIAAWSTESTIARGLGAPNAKAECFGLVWWRSRAPFAPLLAGFVHLDKLATPEGDVGSFDLAVAPLYRGQGLGHAGVWAAEQEMLSRHGLTVFRLGVYQDNEAALALYLSAGYSVLSEIESARPALLLGKCLRGHQPGFRSTL